MEITSQKNERILTMIHLSKYKKIEPKSVMDTLQYSCDTPSQIYLPDIEFNQQLWQNEISNSYFSTSGILSIGMGIGGLFLNQKWKLFAALPLMLPILSGYRQIQNKSSDLQQNIQNRAGIKSQEIKEQNQAVVQIFQEYLILYLTQGSETSSSHDEQKENQFMCEITQTFYLIPAQLQNTIRNIELIPLIEYVQQNLEQTPFYENVDLKFKQQLSIEQINFYKCIRSFLKTKQLDPLENESWQCIQRQLSINQIEINNYFQIAQQINQIIFDNIEIDFEIIEKFHQICLEICEKLIITIQITQKQGLLDQLGDQIPDQETIAQKISQTTPLTKQEFKFLLPYYNQILTSLTNRIDVVNQQLQNFLKEAIAADFTTIKIGDQIASKIQAIYKQFEIQKKAIFQMMSQENK